MKTTRHDQSTIVNTCRSTRTSKSHASRLVLALTLAALAGLSALPTKTKAEDEGAHGGGSDNKTAEALAAGEAVKAPRITEVYAEKGLTQNPVAFDIDPQGNLYIAEGWRAGISVIDNRNGGLRRSNGVINDLKKKSVEDRLAQIKMLEEGGFYPKGTFTKTADKVRFIQDTDGDGKADKSTIFADGFDDPLDGIASGVLFHEGKVYLTNIPHVWLLEDKDGDGDADKDTQGERTSLSYGWGIRWAFYGHDMHGLIKGPDGRIYFSIGDRGYNVTTKEGKKLYGPDRGAVFRMWPDGSGLELYFEGLRNPQELAFDNYGNLFTGDNNSDSGDKARFHYLPEGGDAGWRQDVQSLRDRGPWNREHMWKPRDVGQFGLLQPAWIIPPLKNVGRGPSGLAHYPGTGDVFASNGSFLMCDYPAGVRHVQVQPSGAGFKVTEDSSFVNGGTITDVAWGYDGRLYLSDWGGGWKPNPNGTIKTMTNKAAHEKQAKVIAEVKQLFAEGFEKLNDEKLIALLGHADQRVRIHAQWEIAGRKTIGGQLAELISNKSASDLEKIHAIWAVGMRCRIWGKSGVADAEMPLTEALSSSSPHVRSQAISVIGDLRYPLFISDNLTDDNANVAYCAAIAAGKVGNPKDIPALLDLLDRNDNKDVYIRHAASYGLSLIGDAEAIHREATKRGVGARVGAVLALRRLDSPLLAAFLNDEDPLVAVEAVRAIYDKRVMDAILALAKLADTLTLKRMSEPVMRRVIEANVRLADADSAGRLLRLAGNSEVPFSWREMALKEVDTWSAQRDREGVWGAWWPRPEQSMDAAKKAMNAYLPQVVGNTDGKLLTMARTMMQKYVAKTPAEELIAIAINEEEPIKLRIATLKRLGDADKAKAAATTKQIIASQNTTPELRIQIRFILIGLDQQAGQQSYAKAIMTGELAERQDAIARLGASKGAIPGETFIALTDKLKAGELEPELRLDVVEAVQGNAALPLQARVSVQDYVNAERLPGEKLVRDTVLAGGSIERGKAVFETNTNAGCVSCHDIKGPSAKSGPVLGAAGLMHNETYLYRSLINPSADIAAGFESSTMTLKDGTQKSGRILKAKSDADKIVFVNSEGKEDQILRINLQGAPVRSKTSGMKAMGDQLDPKEIRDLLAYLGSLKDPDQVPAAVTKQAGGDTWPKIKNAMKRVDHVIALPIVLGGIALSLVLLMLLTMFGGSKPIEAHGH